MKKILNIISVLLLLTGLSSCSEELTFEENAQNNITSVLIELPYNEAISTVRSIPTGNAISTLDVLAFDENGTYLYSSESQPLYSIDNGNNYLYTLNIQQQDIANKQTFVFIANMRERIKEVCNEGSGNITKDEIMSQLTFSDCNWNESKSGFPMWSETSVAYDVTQPIKVLDKIKMLRSVAAIEVLVNGNLNEIYGLENFKLTDITLKDFESEGFVAPAEDNITWENDRHVVSAPSVPETSGSSEGYTVSAGTPVNSIIGKLFVAEYNTEKAKSGNKLPSVIIGGYYGKDNTSEKSWYKVNLTRNGEAINIIRNTQYVINITDISSKGFGSMEEAYANESQNIGASLELTAENASGLNNVVYNSSGYLASSSAELKLTKGQEAEIELMTNISGGWSFTSIPEWIEVSAQNGTKDERTSITVKANSTSETLRNGEIQIKAGGLTMQISINETESNVITYTTATAQEVINAETLGIPVSEFKISNGVAFNDKYIYIGNSYYKIENGVFTKKQGVIVYDTESKKVVKTITEWTHNNTTLNFEGTTNYPETLDDIVADPKDNRLYVMRRHSCVDVFDITDPANPVYVTRIGKSMNSTDGHTTFRNSSAIGVCDKAVLIRAAKVLNTYERNTITSENWSNITSKTSDNRNMLDLGYQPRQFATDPVTGRVWLTEFGNDSFKGIYRLDVNRMDNFGNKVYQYCDLRDGSISLSSNPIGMAITEKNVYITLNNGTIDVFDRSVLDLSSTRSASDNQKKSVPVKRAVVENYNIGSMVKLYTNNAEEETFWTCDTKTNSLVLVKIGKGVIEL